MRTSNVTGFWSRVDKDGPIPECRPDLGPCWLWRGKIDRDGYGMSSTPRLRMDVAKTPRAHRVACLDRFDSIQASTPVLDHLCRVRHCVNPEHLEPVTTQENSLRGIGHNSLKTHCPRGHEYTAENTYTRRQSKIAGGELARVCRACAIRRMKEYDQARKPPGWVSRLGAPQRDKTHCPQGHPYDEDNTSYSLRKGGGKSRKCKACVRARTEAWRIKRRATAPAPARASRL